MKNRSFLTPKEFVQFEIPDSVCKRHDISEESLTQVYHVWNGSKRLTNKTHIAANGAWLEASENINPPKP